MSGTIPADVADRIKAITLTHAAIPSPWTTPTDLEAVAALLASDGHATSLVVMAHYATDEDALEALSTLGFDGIPERLWLGDGRNYLSQSVTVGTVTVYVIGPS